MMADQITKSKTESGQLSSKPDVIKLFRHRHHRSHKNQGHHSSTGDVTPGTTIHRTIGLSDKADARSSQIESTTTGYSNERSMNQRYSITRIKPKRSKLSHAKSHQIQVENYDGNDDSKEETNKPSMNVTEESNVKLKKDSVVSVTKIVRYQNITHDTMQTDNCNDLKTADGLSSRADARSNRSQSIIAGDSVEKVENQRYSINENKTNGSNLSHSQSHRSVIENYNENNVSKEQSKKHPLDVKEGENNKELKKNNITLATKMVRYQNITHHPIQTDNRSDSNTSDRLSSRMNFEKESREELKKKITKRGKVAGHCCRCSRLCIFLSISAGILLATALVAALLSILTKSSTTTKLATPTTMNTTNRMIISTSITATTSSMINIMTTSATIMASMTNMTVTATTITVSTGSTIVTTTITTVSATSATVMATTTTVSMTITATTTTVSTTVTVTTSTVSTTVTVTSTTFSMTTTTASTTNTTTSITLTTTVSTSIITTKTSTTVTTTTTADTTTNTTATTTTTTETITYVPTGIYALEIPTCATWNDTGITVAGNSNGTAGINGGSLNTTVSIFIDNNYTLYVCDRENHRIVKYEVNSTTGVVIAGNGTEGSGPNQLNEPKGVAVDQMGAVIVADSLNYRIQRFPLSSTMGTTIAINSLSNLLGETRDLHIDVNNAVYVTDSNYSRIVKYYPNNGIGVILAGSSGPGSGSDQFSNPYGNFMDGNETLYVADYGNHRVQKWLAGATNGTTVAGVTNSSGSTLAKLNKPIAVIVDNNGYVYIADQANHRIVRWTTNYTAGGTCIVGCNGSSGVTATKLKNPRDLKFDASGNLYVSDQGNNRIQKFMIQYPPNCTYTSG